MHCHEAKRRLIGTRRDPVGWQKDEELLEHLRSCASCAREAELAGLMSRLYEAASADDTLDIHPLASARLNIEVRVAAAGKTGRELAHPPRRRHWPAVAAVGAMAVVVLAVLALVPFGFNKTIGYEVAVGGVHRDLVDDDSRLCEAFYHMGLSDASVDVLGCDSTCRLLVFDLRSETEVELAVTVIKHLNYSNLTVDVIPVRTRATQTILGRAGDELL